MNYSTEFNIAETIAAVILGVADHRQQEQLEAWLTESQENRELYLKLTHAETLGASTAHRKAIDLDEVVGVIRSSIDKDDTAGPVLRRSRIWLRAAAAACIVALIGISGFFVMHNEQEMPEIVAAAAPVPCKVKLLLDNGEQIGIDDMKREIITSGGSISRTEEGLVILESDLTTEASRPNKIITEAGGEIKFTLSDGTKVWLNACSELSFPFKFGSDERRVLLTGEAYFEVARNQNSPFIVVANRMDIRVLGTVFNVKAYSDEPRIVTTLVSGKVLVTTQDAKKELQPGMAAELDLATDRMQVCKVDVRLATAWIDGYFMFNDESLDAITRTLARWYDVEFVFETDLSRQHIFNGRIGKYGSIEETLDRITLAGGPAFRIENRKVYVK